MYAEFFSLKQTPFSIAPDPRYLYMTEGHREALAHLLYGINGGGGIVLLTGEVGAGKTTVCRCFLEQIPANCNVAYIFNPKLTALELLRTICEEFHLESSQQSDASIKDYVDALTRHLLSSHAQGRNNLLIIDEAQNLSPEVLEQLRLLTNLETNERKLLQVVLIGQPELRQILEQPGMKQLAQRVIARYHLRRLTEQETAGYIQHRLAVAGLASASPFPKSLIRPIHRLSQGVPRCINLLCDRALLGAYAEGKRDIDRGILRKAAGEVFGSPGRRPVRHVWRYAAGLAAVGVLALAASLAIRQADLEEGTYLAGVLGSIPWPASPIHLGGLAPAAGASGEAQTGSISEIVERAYANKDEARRALAALWQVSLSGTEGCDEAAAYGIRCYEGEGGLDQLRLLNRPAVLTLHTEAGAPRYVLITGLEGGSATLAAGDITRQVSLDALDPYFSGGFDTYWRPPPYYRRPIRAGSLGPDVDWVAARLAKITESQPADTGDAAPSLTKMIREFQAMSSVPEDGVAGPVTLMHLSRAAGLKEPYLQQPAASGSPASE